MKKLILILILLFLPMIIKADYSVNEYKIDITILENGNIEVIEVFKLDGEYNGFERVVNYKGNFDDYRGDFLKSTDTNLYDGEDIILNEIRGINFEDNIDVSSYKKTGDLFKKDNSAKKGDYGVYIIEKNNNGHIYKIYNSSKMNKAFYIDYILEGVIIKHNDVAELFYYTEIDENIDVLEIYIHIPNNQNNLKIWLHHTDCDINIIDQENIVLTTTDFEKIIDFRLLFDTDILITNKKNNAEVISKIETIENDFVNFSEPNDEEYENLKQQVYELVSKADNTKNRSDYESAKKAVEKLNQDDKLKAELLIKLINLETQVERKETIIDFTLFGILGIWFLGLIVFFYQLYKKYSKKNEYYEKILEDKDYKPYVIGYVMNRKITRNELIASILYLIYKNNISMVKKNQTYILEKNSINNLDVPDERLLKLIFNDKSSVSMFGLKKYVKNNYEVFINGYSNWFNATMDKVGEMKIFENLITIKLIGIMYSVIGIFLSIVLYKNIYVRIVIMIISLLLILFFLIIFKRTTKGKFIYDKFNKLKKNLYKEIPSKDELEINLIYSIAFGNLSKIEKNILLNIDILDDKKYYIDVFKKYKYLYDELNELLNTAYKNKKESTL